MTIESNELNPEHIFKLAITSLTGPIPEDVLEQNATDITGANGNYIENGSIIHSSPDATGELVDRPISGYLAQASTDSGIVIEKNMDFTTIAKDFEKAGTFAIDGQEISVLDYIPGGDVLQVATGNVDPAKLVIELAHYGAMQAEQNSREIARENAFTSANPDNSDIERNHDETGSFQNSENHEKYAREEKHDLEDEENLDPISRAERLERLSFQHKLDLDVAVETSDRSEVKTDLKVDGKVYSVKTVFEATAPDNHEERKEAEDHVQDVALSPLDETESRKPNMLFRSQIMAHIEAMSNDDGLSL